MKSMVMEGWGWEMQETRVCLLCIDHGYRERDSSKLSSAACGRCNGLLSQI